MGGGTRMTSTVPPSAGANPTTTTTQAPKSPGAQPAADALLPAGAVATARGVRVSRSGLDPDRVSALRQWANAHVLNPPHDAMPWLGPYVRPLAEIARSAETYVDALVKIVELKRVDGEPPRIYGVVDGSTHEQSEVRADLVFWNLATHATFVRLFRGGQEGDADLEGAWIKLRNVKARHVPAAEVGGPTTLELHAHDGASVVGFVRVPKQCLAPEEMRRKRLAVLPSSSSSSLAAAAAAAAAAPTATTTTTTPKTTLADVLSRRVATFPCTVRCKLVDVLPRDVAEFVNAQTGEWRFVARLEDMTGCVDAVSFGDTARRVLRLDEALPGSTTESLVAHVVDVIMGMDSVWIDAQLDRVGDGDEPALVQLVWCS